VTLSDIIGLKVTLNLK